MNKILFDSDVYIRMLSEVNQQIDYEYETYGETEKYYELCQQYGRLEKKIELALKNEEKK